ncbi:hypothetical protein B7463_g12684, partial [Scytalidium lignicola]
ANFTARHSIMTGPSKQLPLIGLRSERMTLRPTKIDEDSLVLAPEGDVILAVGVKQFRIHVDSLFLKRHSTVFAALFGPNFREGQDLNTSSPKEILLPDDDPDAMTAICAAMYQAFDQIPRSPATDFVLSIIRHADKYDCYDVLTLASQVYSWLKSDHLTNGKDLANILAVSYLVRDQEAFTNASKALVSKYDGSFADLTDNVICDVLPWETFFEHKESTLMFLQYAYIDNEMQLDPLESLKSSRVS